MDAFRAALGAALVEREAAVEAVLMGLVAQEHVLLVGPPGTGKSLLCRSIAGAVSGLRYCERLLSPTTPPEAVFGPVSLSALREDRYEHIGAGTVTDAELVFLDEFFRASDAIRDALLHLLGPERQALIGTRQVKAPLRCCIGAANTWAESADQHAILDRWLIRLEIRQISPAGRERLLYDDLPAVAPALTLADLDAAHAASAKLPVSAAARACLGQILDELAAAGIRPSDRRARAAVKVARAAAQIAGAAEVLPGHLECLRDVLWDVPGEQAAKAAEIVVRLANPVGAKLNALLAECDEVATGAAKDAAARLAAIKKLEEGEKACTGLAKEGNGRASKVLAHIRQERVRLQAAALGIDPEKAAALLSGR
jgi:MoxR-like ATPase